MKPRWASEPVAAGEGSSAKLAALKSWKLPPSVALAGSSVSVALVAFHVPPAWASVNESVPCVTATSVTSASGRSQSTLSFQSTGRLLTRS